MIYSGSGSSYQLSAILYFTLQSCRYYIPKINRSKIINKILIYLPDPEPEQIIPDLEPGKSSGSGGINPILATVLVLQDLSGLIVHAIENDKARAKAGKFS